MMEALLIGLWLLCLLLPFAIRRHAHPAIAIVVLPVVLSDQGAPETTGEPPHPFHGEAWLRRQLEELGKGTPQ